MLNVNLFERAVAWAGTHEPEALSAARARFERKTAPIEIGAPDYESRISHFFEIYLCSMEDGSCPLERYFAQAAPERDFVQATPERNDDAMQIHGFLRSQRALVEVLAVGDTHGIVRDALLAARYRVRLSEADQKLYVGDRFDTRLVPLGDEIVLSAGRVYHPREAHGALDALLSALPKSTRRNVDTLDALLRMRARFLAFQSIRVEHVYRIDALDEPAFAAPWARAKDATKP